MKPLEIRKQLLIAESEVLRLQALEDIQVIRDGARTLRRQAKSLGTAASAAALVIAGISAVRRAKSFTAANHSHSHGNGHAPHAGRSSLLSRVFTGARIAAGVWSALRSRKS